MNDFILAIKENVFALFVCYATADRTKTDDGSGGRTGTDPGQQARPSAHDIDAGDEVTVGGSEPLRTSGGSGGGSGYSSRVAGSKRQSSPR